jgi:hypothetical protein
LGWLGTAIAHGDDGVVLGIVLKFTPCPMKCQLIGEWCLRAEVQGFVVTGGHGHEFAGLGVGELEVAAWVWVALLVRAGPFCGHESGCSFR